MTGMNQRCKAITLSGNRCRNYSAVGSEYCHMHRTNKETRLPNTNQSATPNDGNMANAIGQTTGSTEQVYTDRDIAMLKREVKSLIRELKVQIPTIEASEIGPASLVRLFNRSIGSRLTLSQAAFFDDLERNLADSSFADFTDPEVLRGLALLTYYSAQAQTENVRGQVSEKLQSLPGTSLLRGIWDNLSQTSREDVLDPDTWKGLWFLVTYAAEQKTQELFRTEDDST